MRVRDRIASTLQAQVMTDEPVLGPQGIDDYLRILSSTREVELY